MRKERKTLIFNKTNHRRLVRPGDAPQRSVPRTTQQTHSGHGNASGRYNHLEEVAFEFAFVVDRVRGASTTDSETRSLNS